MPESNCEGQLPSRHDSPSVMSSSNLKGATPNEEIKKFDEERKKTEKQFMMNRADLMNSFTRKGENVLHFLAPRGNLVKNKTSLL